MQPVASAASLILYPGHELLLPEIVHAENGRLRDSHGRTYVDLESGVWCTPIGHGHPRWLRVLAEQSRRIAHTGYCYSSPVVDEAARELLALLGFDNGRCVFLCSGSEAVEYGVRIARTLSDRPLLVTMTDSYFGAYGSASLKRPDEWFCFDWLGCAECRQRNGGDESCEHWAAIPFDGMQTGVDESSATRLASWPCPSTGHNTRQAASQRDCDANAAETGESVTLGMVRKRER